MTLSICYAIFTVAGGDIIVSIIIFLFSLTLSYNLVIICSIKLKSTKFFYNSSFLYFRLFFNYLKNTIKNLKSRLYLRDYPFGLNLRRYILIKYLFSFYILVIVLILSKKIIISVSLFLIIFSLPNIVLYFFDLYENKKIKKDISNIVQEMLILIDIENDIQKILGILKKYIKCKRLKKNFNDICNYEYSKLDSDIVFIFATIINKTREKITKEDLKTSLERLLLTLERRSERRYMRKRTKIIFTLCLTLIIYIVFEIVKRYIK